MSQDFLVTVWGARAEAFTQVFGTNTIPVKSPVRAHIELAGRGLSEVYCLDLDALTVQQRRDLIAHLAHKFNASESAVLLNIKRNGFPILAADTTLAIRNPLWSFG